MREARCVRSIRVLMLATVLGAVLALPGTAMAGRWMVVSCVNPNGSAAPSEGWSGSSAGDLPFGSAANTLCTPQLPMQAALVSTGPAPSGAEELLRYAPPAGSELIGGTVGVGLYPYGYGTGSHGYTWTSSAVFESSGAQTVANTLASCVATSPGTSCPNDGVQYAGSVILPSDAGGDLYVVTQCSGFNPSAGACNNVSNDGDWSRAEVSSARLLLRNDAVPTGGGFGGRLLAHDASGDASLAFTAGDPGGPGVYQVTVQIDGATIYQGIPDSEDGSCQAVGTDPDTGALMFDDQQPCPVSEPVALSIPTGGLRDGAHHLGVTVTDAAGNSTVVLSRRITTRNSGTTRARSSRLSHMHLWLRWRWDGRRTRLIAEHISGLPHGTHLTVRCSGAGCPRLAFAAKASPAGILRAMRGRRFRAGDRVLFTIAAPGGAAVRIRVTIRAGARPRLRVLR